MRNAFADEVAKVALSDKRVILLSGDIGNKLFDSIKNIGEGRFLNCGIAEGNMMGVAAGMALTGLRPIVYTITPFTTTRCFEQIRVDVCYHQAPVVIVGTGSGLSYAELGPTHHSLEDLAILRTLPGIRVVAPCDANELRSVLRLAISDGKPTYIRIGKKGEENIYTDPPNLIIGKSIVVSPGRDIALICAGTLMGEVIRAAEILKSMGISAEVISMHTVKPLDTEYLAKACNRFNLIVSIEEHGLIGGLGGAISEWCAGHEHQVQHLAFGTPDEFMHEVGTQQYARNKYGLTSENIAKSVKNKYEMIGR